MSTTYNNISSVKERDEKLPTINDILDSIDDLSVYSLYIRLENNLSNHILSPFNVEKTPSFRLYESNNKIKFKCFSTGKGGDCIDLVMLLFNLTYAEAVFKIYKDLKNNKSINLPDKQSIPKKLESDKNSCKIITIKQPFTETDLNYWNTFGISVNTLEYFKVSSCKEVWIFNRLWAKYHIKDPVYSYTLNDSVKIYRPFATKQNKFRSNVYDLSHIQGLYQLKYINTDIVFITKSLKDVMVLYELGFEAIALNSETDIPNKQLINHLVSKYKNIIFLYDNDATGIKKAIEYSSMFNIPFIYLDESDTKDCSDYVKKYSKEMLLETINLKLKNSLYG
jgi:DNA primase